MTLCAFVGDEVSAAGFRLAGMQVHVPEPAETAELFHRLCAEVDLLLVTAETVLALPDGTLDRALAAQRPLVLVVPDSRGRVQPTDMALRVRQQLGMAQ